MDQSNHQHDMNKQIGYETTKNKCNVDEVFVEQENQYPVCLNTEHADACTTPLSRLSGVTKQSEIQKYQDSKNTIVSSMPNKVVSRIEIESVEDNLRMEVKNLTDLLSDLKCYTDVLQKRNEEIAVALQKEKLKNNHLQVALGIIRKQDRQLDKKFHDRQEYAIRLRQELENEKNVVESQGKKLEQFQAENNYLKQLIMIANSNYENLQRKYKFSVEKNKRVQQESLRKQKQLSLSINQMKNALTDLISLPGYNSNTNHCLSFGEQDQNCLKKNVTVSTNRNSKKQTEEIYRKMFMKTLRGTK